VPRITGDTEDFIGPVEDEEFFTVSAPAQRRSRASVPTEKPLLTSPPEKTRSVAPAPEEKPATTHSPERKRSAASAPAKRSSVVSILLEKRLASSVPVEAPPAVFAPVKQFSPIPVPSEESPAVSVAATQALPIPVPREERSSLSVFLEKRLMASIPEEKSSTSMAQEGNRTQAVPRRKQPVELVEKVNPTAGNVASRSPRVDVKPATVPPSPKLLKVIRRRREQAPKVFETTSSRFPEAMLKGLKVNVEEDIESSLD